MIDTPFVADTLEVSVNVKSPFLFVIVIAPSDVLISDAIFVLVELVVIVILPFELVILPTIVLDPFELEIVVLPFRFTISPDWL